MNIFSQISSKGLLRPNADDFSSGGGSSKRSQPHSSKTPSTKTPAQHGDQDDTKAADHAEDAELVKKAQAGSTRAFDQLVSKHRGKIYAMIYNMVKNDADAWDLSQEAFIKAWKALPKFEARSRFSTWLFRISHNVVYDWLRKRKIKSDGELNDEIFDAARIDSGAPTAPRHTPRPDEAMEQSELRHQIHAAISKLSADHREVILLREVQGLDYKEIANITGNTLGTVMSRLYYARKRLQDILKPQG